ncbi:M23 family metallopeptidase [Phycicoccus sp. BSK3Z-2]|uniref:M23 family metallopeptidase n=2 Tax=Phycicoccus avicenniae TaxID=2828860 RepID=A0A941I0J2_9MICO|nr:M23 family metallopeptidase [Phycicoccus avicenniae]
MKNNNASHKIGVSGGTGSQFLVPFPCNETWAGQTRSNHSPVNSVDFNHYPDDYGYKVYASAAGTVSRVGNTGSTSYGRYVYIDHGNGWQTRYAHLSSQNVSVGQQVGVRTLIGRVGSTGGSSGPHLHYEQRLNGNDVKVTFKSGNAVYFGTKNFARTTGCP